MLPRKSDAVYFKCLSDKCGHIHQADFVCCQKCGYRDKEMQKVNKDGTPYTQGGTT